nr:hypothetical protein [Halocatena pleomorpha]
MAMFLVIVLRAPLLVVQETPMTGLAAFTDDTFTIAPSPRS